MRAAVARAGPDDRGAISIVTRALPGVLLLAIGLTPAWGQDTPRPAPAEPPTVRPDLVNPLEEGRLEAALTGLEEQASLNEALIDSAVAAYDEAVAARNAAHQLLLQGQRRLDEIIDNDDALTAGVLSATTSKIESARAEVFARETDVGRMLDDLRRLLYQREALAERIAILRLQLPSEREFLTGVWEVRWFPAGVTGTFFIDQSGTLVTGQYRLRPLGSGSLQGTFVSGKLRLQRIDRERGRDAELEGFVDADGRQIRGTWQGYELVQGGLPHGQWVAQRVK
ncbi:MAG: hypothetical protein OEQ13_03310 [Acidobacteriota bacterium]|nr:hypothetical protein [Acidobacteriota bacterium]